MAQRTVPSPTSDAVPASSCTSSSSDAASSHKSFTSADVVKGRRVRSVSLAVGDGETLVVLGPSGAGKTSLLRLLAGLERVDSGRIVLDGKDVTNVPAERRGVSFVSQDDSLFPHLSVYENLAFAMRLQKAGRDAIDRAVWEYARVLDIERHLDAVPSRLSGGERQRVAFARALLAKPRALLLDEPFAHLDPQLRVHVRRRFRQARRLFPGPVIHVTHDHAEALAIADRLAVMIGGGIVQCGDPQSVYDAPASVEVAKFVGSPPMNLLDDGAFITGIRPEHVVISTTGELTGIVAECETIGPDALLRVNTPRAEVVVSMLRDTERTLPPRGARVAVHFPPQFVRRFDRTTGLLIQ